MKDESIYRAILPKGNPNGFSNGYTWAKRWASLNNKILVCISMDNIIEISYWINSYRNDHVDSWEGVKKFNLSEPDCVEKARELCDNLISRCHGVDDE